MVLWRHRNRPPTCSRVESLRSCHCVESLLGVNLAEGQPGASLRSTTQERLFLKMNTVYLMLIKKIVDGGGEAKACPLEM